MVESFLVGCRLVVVVSHKTALRWMQEKLVGRSKLLRDMLDVAVLHYYMPNWVMDADTFARVLRCCTAVV